MAPEPGEHRAASLPSAKICEPDQCAAGLERPSRSPYNMMPELVLLAARRAEAWAPGQPGPATYPHPPHVEDGPEEPRLAVLPPVGLHPLVHLHGVVQHLVAIFTNNTFSVKKGLKANKMGIEWCDLAGGVNGERSEWVYPGGATPPPPPTYRRGIAPSC